MKHRIQVFSALVAFALLASQVALATGFNIDFGDDYFGLPAGYSAASGQAGFWNEVFANGTLNDLSGAPTSVTVSVTGSTSGNAGTPTTNDQILLNDNFFFSSGWNLDFTNLSDGLYDLYYYAPTNGGVSTGEFTANGISGTELPGDPGGTLILGTSYDVVSSVNVVGGTLSLSSVGGQLENNFGLAGLQIIRVPEPATVGLCAFGLVTTLVTRRRRLRPAKR